MTCDEGLALNLRPVSADLRDALRELAKAEGTTLYQYTIAVLTAHVAKRRRDPDTAGAMAQTNA